MKNLRKAALTVCALILLCAISLSSPYTDWSMCRGNVASNGTGIGDSVEGPTLLWQTNVNTLINPNVIADMSAPYIVGGTVFVGELTYVPVEFFFDHVGNILAFNATSGVLNWNCSGLGEGGISTFAILGGIAYFASGDGYVAALNMSDLTVLWRFWIDPGPYGFPSLVNGVVYMSGIFDSPFNIYKVCAINATDGLSIWNYTTQDLNAPVTVYNGVVYFGSYDGNFYALNATDATFLWSYPTGQIDNSAVVSAGVVYVGAGPQNLYAFNASNGEKLWNWRGDENNNPIAVSNGIVYTSGSNEVYGLQASNGSLLWDFNVGARTIDDTIVAGGVVYAIASGGFLSATDAFTGTQLWNYSVSDPSFDFQQWNNSISMSLAFSDGILYISWGPLWINGMLRSNDSELTALQVPSPTPTPSLTPAPTQTKSSSPSASIPEFPTRIILPPIAVSMFLAVLLTRKKIISKARRKFTT